VYCRHGIVHNKKVVEEFEGKGVVFVEEIKDIPDGSVVVLSAHGTSPEVVEQAKQKHLKIVDSVCPLVTKVHMEAKKYSGDGYFVLYLGHKGHQEAIGVLGEVKGQSILISTLEEAKHLEIPEKAVLLTQTTLSVDETKEIIDFLKKRWPNLVIPPGKDICFSTTNRQWAVKELMKSSDFVLVVGSKTSSNSKRLQEVAGSKAHLVDGPEDLHDEWFQGVRVVGITAGASVPEKFIQPVVDAIQKQYGGVIEELTVLEEHVSFPNLPKEIESL
jgi:4-hydroxy-3-methylbut-2-enyl diphosphate reductase